MDKLLEEFYRRISFIEGELTSIKELLKRLKELEDASR